MKQTGEQKVVSAGEQEVGGMHLLQAGHHTPVPFWGSEDPQLSAHIYAVNEKVDLGNNKCKYFTYAVYISLLKYILKAKIIKKINKHIWIIYHEKTISKMEAISLKY